MSLLDYNNPYDKYIAEAAREYIKEYYRGTNVTIKNTFTKLLKMIEAERKGSNPRDSSGENNVDFSENQKLPHYECTSGLSRTLYARNGSSDISR
jgi:hypothetical protein